MSESTPAIGPFFLAKPTEADINDLLDTIPKKQYNFSNVGITQTAPPLENNIKHEGFKELRTQVFLGTGHQTFKKGVQALKNWKHFNLDWAFVNKTPVKKGAPVVVTAQSLCLWSCNPLKVSFVEQGKLKRDATTASSGGQKFSFGHTCLEGHQFIGEEKFSLEWRKADDSVWYEVYSVSKPATPIVWLAQPLARFYQRKFAADSIAAMKRETS